MVKLCSEQEVENFDQEVSILQALSHKNIVVFYGASINSEQRVGEIIMEHLPYSLAELLYKKEYRPPGFLLNSERKIKIAREIAHGMAYLHSADQPIVHFDLKPANIMLTDGGETCRIIDFGLAKTQMQSHFSRARLPDQAAASGIGRGTVPYMAPELFQHEFPVTSKVDGKSNILPAGFFYYY
jgi:serine/threonine protein kinase